MSATVTPITSARTRKAKATPGLSIISLAKTGGAGWDTFFNCCALLADEGTVEILGCSKPVTHQDSSEKVRTIEAVVRHANTSEAYALFHVGVKGDVVFTGYPSPAAFHDYYRVRLSTGQVYASRLWCAHNKAGPVHKAWDGVAPITMIIWWATYARLLDERPLIGRPVY